MTESASPLEAFEEVAIGFCAWCEGESLGAEPETMAALWLARLHACAQLLPETEPDNEAGIPKLPQTQLAQVERNLKPFVGCYYRVVFDPDPTKTEEPVTGDLGDDVFDTYKDIKAGCLLSQQGRSSEAFWYWSFMHQVHWGQHVVGALAALHANKQARRQ